MDGDLDGAADKSSVISILTDPSLEQKLQESSHHVCLIQQSIDIALSSLVLAHSRSSINICRVNKVTTITGSGKP